MFNAGKVKRESDGVGDYILVTLVRKVLSDKMATEYKPTDVREKSMRLQDKKGKDPRMVLGIIEG